MHPYSANRAFTRSEEGIHTALGFLEVDVMEVLWTGGQSSVRDVVQKLERRLAYTTVMTTLDRLFKKGMLDGRSRSAHFYICRDVESSGSASALAIWSLVFWRDRNRLASCCCRAWLTRSANTTRLLDQLEEKIRKKRRELSAGGKS